LVEKNELYSKKEVIFNRNMIWIVSRHKLIVTAASSE